MRLLSADDTRTETIRIETIRIERPIPRGWNWTPLVGSETRDLITRLELPTDSAAIVQREAMDVLARCPRPGDATGEATGLVVGYVQSGKTLSFTTVATLARDNGYRIIIVVTGISLPLLHQSYNRLAEDLNLESANARNHWAVFLNPGVRGSSRRRLEAALDRWADMNVPDIQRSTVLIVVMKNHIHLDNLNELLRRVGPRLSHAPTLIIDDEADQAGLNTRARMAGEQSATYQRLLTLRAALQHRTHLQYTATPQAPLLISLIDQLSPQFACVLTPGAEYTGGQAFFQDGVNLLRPLPPSEVVSPGAFMGADPPGNLLNAMCVFLVGVASGLLQDNGEGNRSMLVHPSQRTSDHALFRGWVEETLRNWRRILEAPETDPDNRDLLDDFRAAYDDLDRTVEDIPGWDVIVTQLRRACRETIVTEINARGQITPQIDWAQDYAHIVVGGQALDRGVTIPGLTVTYMPRLPGVGNADTIQQRARFFGYKQTYLGYCRLYLAVETLRAYRAYVEHEESMRDQLRRFQVTGRPLSEWKRRFFLDQSLRPTRTNVLSLDYMRGGNSEWTITVSSHLAPEVLDSNRTLLDGLAEHWKFAEMPGSDNRTPEQRPLRASAPLSDVYEHLLTSWRIPALQPQYTGLLLTLERYLAENPEAECVLYELRGHQEGGRRNRKANPRTGTVEQLFQGAHPRDGSIYVGDRQLHGTDLVTLQIHRVNLTHENRGIPFILDVPVLAVWIPPEVRRDWVVGHVSTS